MTEWGGQEIPPAAQARIARAATDHVRSSLLTVPGQAAAQGVGLDPVGEVMGCIVEHIGFAGYGGCGAYVGFGGGFGAGLGRTVTSSETGGYGGYAPYVNALYHGYDTALRRMLLEAQALGADGVVGVRWTQEHMAEYGAREFVARGTAVKARSATRPRRLFSTDLPGSEVATIMHGGWFPVTLSIGISVSIRHDDYMTRIAAGSWSGTNVEIPGYSELVNYARADARHRFEQRAAKAGADAATVSDMGLHVWAIEPNEGHRDHVAEATIVGNAIVRFHREALPPTDSLTVVPLRGMTT